jgi:hypothetical protein
MMSSRSKSKTWLIVLAQALVLLGLAGSAFADKRKRVVVLPFEGAKAEKFHAAVVKLVKKGHTVVPVAKWEGAGGDLTASKGNIKKVAKKLKIDGVIEGKIDKRRSNYIIKLKLRAGATGAVAASASTKAVGPKLDGDASSDVKSELISGIGDLDSVRGGGGDDEEEEPKTAKKKPGKGDDDDEEDAPKTAKKKPGKGDDDEEKPAKASKFGGGKMRGDDEEAALKPKKDKDDEEEDPLPKKRPSKASSDGDGDEVAKKGDGEEIEETVEEPGIKMESAVALSPGNRAIDATFGLSLNARRLSWKTAGDLAPSMGVMGQGKPPNYKGVPAPGAVIDLTAYPLAFGHKSHGMLKNIGLTVMYDQALLISSEAGGEKKDTAASRYAVGGVFRYPFNKSATSPVVGLSVAYGGQKFQIQGPVDLPNVNYAMIVPGLFFHYPISEKLILNTAVSYMVISKTGQMTNADQGYGGGNVSGLEAELGGDYALTKSIFARAALKLETIGYKFNNNAGTLATDRDADPEQDVFGARDTYIGAAVTVGYLY